MGIVPTIQSAWTKRSASSSFQFAVCIVDVKEWLIITFAETSLVQNDSVHISKTPLPYLLNQPRSYPSP